MENLALSWMGGGGVPRGPRRGSAAARRRVGGAWDTVGVEVARVGKMGSSAHAGFFLGVVWTEAMGLGLGASGAGLWEREHVSESDSSGLNPGWAFYSTSCSLKLIGPSGKTWILLDPTCPRHELNPCTDQPFCPSHELNPRLAQAFQ